MSVKLVGIFSPLSGLSSEELGNLAMGVIELVEAADRITGSQSRQTVMHAAPGIRCRGLDFCSEIKGISSRLPHFLCVQIDSYALISK